MGLAHSIYSKIAVVVKCDFPHEPPFAGKRIGCARLAGKGKLAALVLRTLDIDPAAPGEAITAKYETATDFADPAVNRRDVQIPSLLRDR